MIIFGYSAVGNFNNMVNFSGLHPLLADDDKPHQILHHKHELTWIWGAPQLCRKVKSHNFNGISYNKRVRTGYKNNQFI
jgi:hypothetical protein